MDLNVRAFRVVQAAISGPTESIVDAKKASARKGGPHRRALTGQVCQCEASY
jgi:hypothetical protein